MNSFHNFSLFVLFFVWYLPDAHQYFKGIFIRPPAVGPALWNRSRDSDSPVVGLNSVSLEHLALRSILLSVVQLLLCNTGLRHRHSCLRTWTHCFAEITRLIQFTTIILTCYSCCLINIKLSECSARNFNRTGPAYFIRILICVNI